jgi:hypothetical protein
MNKGSNKNLNIICGPKSIEPHRELEIEEKPS